MRNLRFAIAERTASRTLHACLSAIAAIVISGVFAACDRPSDARSGSAPAQPPSAATLSTIGRQLFFDSALSASGHLSCATCHDPNHAWGQPNALPVQLGGIIGKSAGIRAVPSLRYAQDTPPFTEHFHEDDGDDSEDLGPTGGFMWDGRAASTQEQAALPLLSPFEMANASRAAVLASLRTSRSANVFRAAFGAHIFDDSV
ncbi:MAG: cytochrome c peroxidase, partial [Gemmatimonadaceae bacterium]